MKIIWNSYKGVARHKNNDYGAIYDDPNYLIAIIVDISEKNPRLNSLDLGKVLSHELITKLKEHLYNQVEGSPFRLIYLNLREIFLYEVASYAIAILNKRSMSWKIFSLGDCRVGFLIQNQYQWLTEPDTHQNIEDCGHILTKCFKATHYHAPTEYTYSFHDSPLILCTDGYWRDYLDQRLIPPSSIDDDYSFLTITDYLQGNLSIEYKEMNFNHTTIF